MSKTACSDDNDITTNKKLKIDSDDELNLEEEDNIDEITLLNKTADTYGIVERVNKDFKRFTGLIKQSSADFIVNEIDSDANVIRLTNFDLPVLEKNQDKEISRLELHSAVEKSIGEEKFKELTQFLDSNSRATSFKVEAPSDFIKTHQNLNT